MGETREQFVTIRRAAALLGVSDRTMARILDEGKVECIRPRVYRRVSVASLMKYRNRRSENGANESPVLVYDPLED